MSGRYCVHCQRRKRVGDCDRISTHCCNRYKVQSASKSALLLLWHHFTVHITSGFLTPGIVPSPTGASITLFFGRNPRCHSVTYVVSVTLQNHRSVVRNLLWQVKPSILVHWWRCTLLIRYTFRICRDSGYPYFHLCLFTVFWDKYQDVNPIRHRQALSNSIQFNICHSSLILPFDAF